MFPSRDAVYDILNNQNNCEQQLLDFYNAYIMAVSCVSVYTDAGDYNTDNAKGFYVTTNREFVLNRAQGVCRKLNIALDNDSKRLPVVVSFDFDEDSASEQFNCKNFLSPDKEWKYFVFINRLGMKGYKKYESLFENNDNNLDFKYDIVFDPTADAEKAIKDSGVIKIYSSDVEMSSHDSIEEWAKTVYSFYSKANKS